MHRATAVCVVLLAACSNESPKQICDPVLPVRPSGYTDNDTPVPPHFLESPSGTVEFVDNTPADNRVTNAGALLGRVLFYDVRLSRDSSLACGSCHRQVFGFTDRNRSSIGIHGRAGRRRTLALINARFNEGGRFFWDARASSLEHQVLEPISDTSEMGTPAKDLAARLDATSYYPALFAAAFGSKQITNERISRSLAQFVRTLISAKSRFDEMSPAHSAPRPEVLTDEERRGQRLFVTSRCVNCHRTTAQIADQPTNNGLDVLPADTGAGKGRFKPASLRNVAVRAPYMHDGRFASLRDVVQFYSTGVKNSPDLDNRLRGTDGLPRRLNLSPEEIQALVSFLGSLTDTAFLSDPRFSNPFRCKR